MAHSPHPRPGSAEYDALEREVAAIRARRAEAGTFAAAPMLRKDEPLSSVWVTPADVFEQQARALRDDPERVARAERVADWLRLLLAHEVSHVEFDKAVSGYAIWCAVRVWGPYSPEFADMMRVLDDRLIRMRRVA